jgi:hypothetical protein
VVSRLIKLDGSFQAVRLLRNKHFRINIFKVCGPAGYTYLRCEGSLRWRHGVDKRHYRINNKEFLSNMTLRYWIARLLTTGHEAPENAQSYSALFIHFVIILWFFPRAEHTWHSILLAEEVSQCPLASFRWDILFDRASVGPLATCSVMLHRLVIFSHDVLKMFRIVRSSKWENILSCKGSNPCSVKLECLA